jgi:hypothetical protein
MSEVKQRVPTSDKALQGVLELYMSARPDFARAFARCESPIEQLFLVAVARLALKHGSDGAYFGDAAADVAMFRSSYGEDGICDDDIVLLHQSTWTMVLQQPSIEVEEGTIRPDFAVISIDAVDGVHVITGKTAVELDGHEWHERTKEQARSDRQRDRRLLRAGWHVARFTGSEIHEDVDACLLETLGAANAAAGFVYSAAMEMVEAREAKDGAGKQAMALPDHQSTGGT